MSIELRQLRWTFCALLFLALLAMPREGWASCGDYLRHSAQSEVDRHHNGIDEDGPLKPIPCRGPHCSQRTPVPAAPAVPKFTSPGPRDQVYWMVHVPVDEVAASWKLDEASNLPSLPIAGRLFRPPRT